MLLFTLSRICKSCIIMGGCLSSYFHIHDAQRLSVSVNSEQTSWWLGLLIYFKVYVPNSELVLVVQSHWSAIQGKKAGLVVRTLDWYSRDLGPVPSSITYFLCDLRQVIYSTLYWSFPISEMRMELPYVYRSDEGHTVPRQNSSPGLNMALYNTCTLFI